MRPATELVWLLLDKEAPEDFLGLLGIRIPLHVVSEAYGGEGPTTGGRIIRISLPKVAGLAALRGTRHSHLLHL